MVQVSELDWSGREFFEQLQLLQKQMIWRQRMPGHLVELLSMKAFYLSARTWAAGNGCNNTQYRPVWTSLLHGVLWIFIYPTWRISNHVRPTLAWGLSWMWQNGIEYGYRTNWWKSNDLLWMYISFDFCFKVLLQLPLTAFTSWLLYINFVGISTYVRGIFNLYDKNRLCLLRFTTYLQISYDLRCQIKFRSVDLLDTWQNTKYKMW